ncbi:relaxase/mobilization nuclease domain-containing protein [Bacteroides faecis]|uniref:relaxase/mobilization nuclease domain-containing protein n=1 Tax=Bacteroides faecis TaxID=674529 RepID=UPI00101ED35F|nr:relaxase/mobilization nuclease domain-containing protein [Bacteroides faecis]KAA5262177.1 relaxase/mobilization nuclease domain-containing protein [Bacteroides faecis]MCE9012144.1 relaxase/mobilization nuclease domain-containing protein [Bacteroides faecis]RYT79840.1 relaxase [Bacteroides faecis]
MVAKISHGSSVYGVFEYNQNKVDNGEATVLNSFRFIHDENYHHSVSNCVRSLEDWLNANKRTEKPMVHISLNPDPKDVINDEQAVEIAEKYLDQMGYADQPYILYKHEDIARTHYHIVTICVGLDGVKINSDFEKTKSMKICRDIEIEYGLNVPTQKKKSDGKYLDKVDTSYLEKIDYSKGDLKKAIAKNVNAILENYNIRNMSEYKTILELYNITVTEVNGRKGEKVIKGLIYSATDEDGKKVGRQLKSSILGKKFGRDQLEKKFASSKQIRLSRKDKAAVMTVLLQSMYQCKLRTRSEFTELLRERGLDLVLKEKKDGKLFGVTIVDHHTQRILKGSEINTIFSAKSLKEFFDNPNYIIPIALEVFPIKEKEEDHSKNLESSILDGLFIGRDFDPEEEAYKRIQRKKKKSKNPIINY